MSKHNTVNTGRQLEIDLLKAFSIITMIICHVFDIMTTTGEGDDLLKHIIYFFGNLSSGLFIICMGIGIVYTTHDSPPAFAKRGIKLLLQGYLLNFFKNFLPLLFLTGFNPLEIDQEDRFSTFSTEILTLAGLVFLLTALLKKLKCKPWIYCAVALTFQVIATVFNGAFDNSPIAVRYILGLFFYTGSPIVSGYPLFVFYIYVCFGMLFGKSLQYTENKRKFYLKWAVCGAAVFVVSSVIYKLVKFNLSDYYLTETYHANILPAAIWFIGLSVIWAAVSYPASLIINAKTRNAVMFLSRNITNIYVIHWFCIIFVMLTLYVIAGGPLPPIAGLPLSAAICLITIALSKLWNTVKTKIKKKEPGNVATSE